MTDEQLREKIEDFLLGKLPPAEQAAFEKEVEADAQLAQEVESHHEALQAVDRLMALDLKEKFSLWDAETGNPDVTPPSMVSPQMTAAPNRRRLLFGTLALLLLTSIFVFVYWINQPQTPDSKTAPDSKTSESPADTSTQQPATPLQNQPPVSPDSNPQTPAPSPQNEPKNPPDSKPQKPPVVPQTPPASPIYAAILEVKSPENFGVRSDTSLAARAFDKGRFAEAVVLADQAYSANPKDRTALRIKAKALFELGKFAEARQVFLQIGKPEKLDYVQWHVLLCELASAPAMNENLKSRLKKIAEDDGHEFHPPARKLLEFLQARKLISD